ncbi:hypothetical protein EYF80_050018 [Liparis tanakae]|uniref:Uncharacterized protein n=1 Tax=Liparis tanakae TaxID=230148 RepID=A0A4Z2FFZ6_9TELE|nr:hypothetical protein EYF80_050018 [Liparis tanakae]
MSRLSDGSLCQSEIRPNNVPSTGNECSGWVGGGATLGGGWSVGRGSTGTRLPTGAIMLICDEEETRMGMWDNSSIRIEVDKTALPKYWDRGSRAHVHTGTTRVPQRKAPHKARKERTGRKGPEGKDRKRSGDEAIHGRVRN